MARVSLSSDLLPFRRRSRVLNFFFLGAFLVTIHHFVVRLYHRDDGQRQQQQKQPFPIEDPLPWADIASSQRQLLQDSASVSASSELRSSPPSVVSDTTPSSQAASNLGTTPQDDQRLLSPIAGPQRQQQQQQQQQGTGKDMRPTDESQDWKAKVEALTKQIQELQSKLKHDVHEDSSIDRAQPYRIRLEDDPVSMDTTNIPGKILKTKTSGPRHGNMFRNIKANKQHGGSHNEIIYMQSDRHLRIPQWDQSKPLPTWWEETQRFIKEMDARPNMGSMPDKYILVDVCIWLGYNNIRYILEMGSLFAEMINRTLVFPEYVYMRACDEPDLCRLYGTLEDLSYQPDFQPFPRWTFPIHQVWDFAEIRKHQNVLTASEFVKVQLFKHGVVVDDPKEWIESRGGEYGLAQPTNVAMAFLDLDNSLTMQSHDFLDEWYPWASNRIGVDDTDFLPNRGIPPSREQALKELREQKERRQSQQQQQRQKEHEAGTNEEEDYWEDADEGAEKEDDANLFVQPLTMHLWSYGYAPDMSLNTTFEQDINIRWVEDHHRNELDLWEGGGIPVGFKQTYGNISADYLHWIEGLHRFAVPPCRFTTQAGRDRYGQIVLHNLKFHGDILAARDYLLRKLQERIGYRRSYQAVHLRQGDMRDSGWFPDITNEEIARNVAYSLWRHRKRGGRGIDGEGLNGKPRSVVCDSDTRKTKKGEVVWSLDGSSYVAQAGEDRPATWDEMMECLDRNFFFATDSDDPSVIKIMGSYGGFQLEDLIDADFLEKHIKISAFGDLKGIMDQWMMANARHFLGSFTSSLSGGVLNQRLEIGKRPKTSSFLNFHRDLRQNVDDMYYRSKIAALSTEAERAQMIQEYSDRKRARAYVPESPFQSTQGDTIY